MNSIHWVGLDIGGANLKLATTDGFANSVPFELWRNRDQLPAALGELLAPFPASQVAVTMTGELADCFADKKEGVAFIVDAACEAAQTRKTCFYQLDGSFAEAGEAKNSWAQTAASNWHAIASFSCRYLSEETGFLIDLGSTTCDIVPVQAGIVLADSPNDFQRLRDGQLVYVGATRTPLCSLVQEVEIEGLVAPVAREFFATLKDVFIYRGELAENEQDCHTADGQPATRRHSARRLARCFCEDAEALEPRWLDALAWQSRAQVCELVSAAIKQVLDANLELARRFVLAGEGAWLAEEVLEATIDDLIAVRLKDQLTAGISDCAAAYAVAQLAALNIDSQTGLPQ